MKLFLMSLASTFFIEHPVSVTKAKVVQIIYEITKEGFVILSVLAIALLSLLLYSVQEQKRGSEQNNE